MNDHDCPDWCPCAYDPAVLAEDAMLDNLGKGDVPIRTEVRHHLLGRAAGGLSRVREGAINHYFMADQELGIGAIIEGPLDPLLEWHEFDPELTEIIGEYAELNSPGDAVLREWDQALFADAVKSDDPVAQALGAWRLDVGSEPVTRLIDTDVALNVVAHNRPGWVGRIVAALRRNIARLSREGTP